MLRGHCASAKCPVWTLSKDFCMSFRLRRKDLAPSDWPQWPGLMPLTHLPVDTAGPCQLWLQYVLLSWMPSPQARTLAGKRYFNFLFENTVLPFYYRERGQTTLLRAENVTQTPRCVAISLSEENCGMTCQVAGQFRALKLAPWWGEHEGTVFVRRAYAQLGKLLLSKLHCEVSY